MIKVVFMDIDDTIYDYSAFVKKAIKDGFEKYGLHPYSDGLYEVYYKINNQLWISAEYKKLTVQELNSICWNRFFEEIGIAFDSRLFEEYFCKELYRSAIFESNALEIIKYLKGKYVLCIASNAPYEQQINRLKAEEIDTFFSHFLFHQELKPKSLRKHFLIIVLRNLERVDARILCPKKQ